MATPRIADVASSAPPAIPTPPSPQPWRVVFRRDCLEDSSPASISPDEHEVMVGCGARFEMERGRFLGSIRDVPPGALLNDGRVVRAVSESSIAIARADDVRAMIASRTFDSGTIAMEAVASDGGRVATLEWPDPAARPHETLLRVLSLPSFEPVARPMPLRRPVREVLHVRADGTVLVLHEVGESEQLVRHAPDGSELEIGGAVQRTEEVAVSRNGAWALVWDAPEGLRLRDTNTGEVRSVVPLPVDTLQRREDLLSLAVSDDGMRVAWVAGGALHVLTHADHGDWSEIASVPMDDESSLTFIDNGHALLGGNPMVLVREGGVPIPTRPHPYDAHVPRGFHALSADELRTADGLIARYEPTREESSTSITVYAHDLDEFVSLPEQPEIWGEYVASRFYPPQSPETARERRRARFHAALDEHGAHLASFHFEVGDCGTIDYDVSFRERDGVLYQIEITSDGLSSRRLDRLRRAFAMEPFGDAVSPAPAPHALHHGRRHRR